MKIWATSDTHFGHEKLIQLSNRPVDFGERLLKDISQKQGDLLIHCGDFCIGNDQEHIDKFMEASKGFKRKILVRGNHDNKSYSWYLKNGFDHVCEVMQMRICKKEVLFSHMPILRDSYKPSPYYSPVRHIHGHLHGDSNRHTAKEIYDPEYHYDLAPETNDYKLVNVENLILNSLSE